MQLIRRILSKFYEQITLLSGIVSVCFFVLAWCFSTVSYKGSIYALLHLVASIVAAICYTLCLKLCAQYAGVQNNKQASTQKQLQLLNITVIVVFVLVFLYDIRTGGFGSKKNFLCLILADFVWIVCGMWNIRSLQYEFLSDVRSMFICIRKHVPLLVLLAISLILAIEPGELQFRWDGALYEQACRNMNLHSLSSLGAYGHLSQAYGSLYCLIYAIVGHVGISMAILNTILYLGSIIAFYALIRRLLTKRSQFVYVMGTAMYAFSPFILGMVNYFSLDYITLCTFVIMVYFAYTEKWVLHFVTALCFVFTKEPAFVVYAAFCAGMVLVDFLREGKLPFVNKLKRLVCRKKYYLMLLIGALWIMLYLLIGGWSGGVGAFEIDPSYAIDKLKVLYILNFNWLMALIAMIGCAVTLWCKIRNKKLRNMDSQGIVLWWLPLLCCLIAFTLFSIAFKTVNHARYVAAEPVMLYLFAWYVIAGRGFSGLRQNISCAVLFVCTVLMLISSYATIDPLSLASFTQVNTGNCIMITTGDTGIGDSMIYNKQMLYEGEAFQ